MNVQVVPDKTLETLSREALAIQNVCKACGLAQRFAEFEQVEKLARGEDIEIEVI